MTFWEKVKKDVQKGFKEGVAFMKEGATVVMEKAEELTDEGKKRLRIFDLQTKVQKEIGDLGGRVYDLSAKVKNPMLDKKVKAIVSRVKKLELQIKKLESTSKPKAKKTAGKKTVSRKGTVKKVARTKPRKRIAKK